MLAARSLARRSPPRRIAPPAGGALIETVTLDNYSGAERANPWISFRRSFVAGEVPAGSKVEMRYGGTALTYQQADARTTDDAGNLRHATFSAQLPATVADAGSVEIELWSVTGDFDNTSPILRSAITAHDYKMRLRIDGTDYWCRLNNCDAAGEFAGWEERGAGPACRVWHHWGVFRAGQGATDTDEGQMQGHFYTCVWRDGTISVWPQFLNGRIAMNSARFIEEMEFLDGSTSLRSDTASYAAAFPMPPYCSAWLCTADVQPHWTANPTWFHTRISPERAWATGLLPYFHTTPEQNAAFEAAPAIDYRPSRPAVDGTWRWDGADGGHLVGPDAAERGAYVGGMGVTGYQDWIGWIPSHTLRAMHAANDPAIAASTRKALLTYSRGLALCQGGCNGWLIEPQSGMPQPVIPGDWTGAPHHLAASQPTMRWSSDGSAGAYNPRPINPAPWQYAQAGWDHSHGPSWCFFEWMTSGAPWWIDHIAAAVNGYLGNASNGGTEWDRNPLVNGVQYEGNIWTAHRNWRINAWQAREASHLAFTIPDDHRFADYARTMWAGTVGATHALMEPPNYPAELEALGYFYDNVVDKGHLAAPWQGTYCAVVIMMMLQRGQITASHNFVAKFLRRNLFGMVNACPHHAAVTFYLSMCQGPSPGPVPAEPWADSWDQVYIGDGSTQPYKLVSDDSFASGTCPGLGTGFAGKLTFDGSVVNPPYEDAMVRQWHAVLEMGVTLGITEAISGAALPHMRNEESLRGLSEAFWATGMPACWRIRQPPA